MTDKIQKATQLSTLISSWGKILFVVASLISGCFFFYYQVQSNASKIDGLEIKISDLEINVEREFEVVMSRSDKRYNRAMSTASELKELNKELINELSDLNKEIWYLKGKLDSE